VTRARRLAKARSYNALLMLLTVGIPALLVFGTWLDGDSLFYGVAVAVLAFLILLMYVVYPNWLNRRD
jgi:hypothetical protein